MIYDRLEAVLSIKLTEPDRIKRISTPKCSICTWKALSASAKGLGLQITAGQMAQPRGKTAEEKRHIDFSPRGMTRGKDPNANLLELIVMVSDLMRECLLLMPAPAGFAPVRDVVSLPRQGYNIQAPFSPDSMLLNIEFLLVGFAFP